MDKGTVFRDRPMANPAIEFFFGNGIDVPREKFSMCFIESCDLILRIGRVRVCRKTEKGCIEMF